MQDNLAGARGRLPDAKQRALIVAGARRLPDVSAIRRRSSVPSLIFTAVPPTRTALTLPPALSASTCSRLGRPISKPCSTTHRNVPVRGSRDRPDSRRTRRRRCPWPGPRGLRPPARTCARAMCEPGSSGSRQNTNIMRRPGAAQHLRPRCAVRARPRERRAIAHRDEQIRHAARLGLREVAVSEDVAARRGSECARELGALSAAVPVFRAGARR